MVVVSSSLLFLLAATTASAMLMFTTLRPSVFRRRAIAGASIGHSLRLLSTASTASSPEWVNEFSKLGVLPDLVKGMNEQNWRLPTPVQKAVIPRLLGGENIVMAASTGSGKTLAFILPALQKLSSQEEQGYTRLIRRPRCLVLVPTRELARQVLGCVKSLSHFSKISSCAILGGEQYGIQKKNLDRMVDIVVASPGRLVQHKEQGNLYLSQVDTVIIDEVDTMLMQGFGPDIRAILRGVLQRQRGVGGDNLANSQPVQLVMATATLTKAVRALLADVKGDGGNGFIVNFTPEGDGAYVNKTLSTPLTHQVRVNLNIVEVDGLHRSLPSVRHVVDELKGTDKLVALQSIVQRQQSGSRTMLFCNSVASVRAVQYNLVESGTPALSYHGDLNSREREANLEAFRNGTGRFLVCTDIAARGLDVPEIDHVVMVDFPLNPIDYLHRAGRCGRAGRKGLVTSIVAKRDKVLSDAIQGAIARGLPLDNLSSNKRDYQDNTGKLAQVIGRKPRGGGASVRGGRGRDAGGRSKAPIKKRS